MDRVIVTVEIKNRNLKVIKKANAFRVKDSNNEDLSNVYFLTQFAAMDVFNVKLAEINREVR